MKNLHYLIWVKCDDSKYSDHRKLVGFVHKEDLFILPLSIYSEWSDEHEKDMYYVSIPEKTERYRTVEMELPWSDGPHTVYEPIFSSTEKEYWDEEEAFNNVYTVLAELNNIPVFEEALNLVKETPFVYSINNNFSQMITITYKAGKHLIYDSLLEKITIFPPITLVGDFYEKTLKDYLQVR